MNLEIKNNGLKLKLKMGIRFIILISIKNNIQLVFLDRIMCKEEVGFCRDLEYKLINNDFYYFCHLFSI
jgi:hypothetical protein